MTSFLKRYTFLLSSAKRPHLSTYLNSFPRSGHLPHITNSFTFNADVDANPFTLGFGAVVVVVVAGRSIGCWGNVPVVGELDFTLVARGVSYRWSRVPPSEVLFLDNGCGVVSRLLPTVGVSLPATP